MSSSISPIRESERSKRARLSVSPIFLLGLFYVVLLVCGPVAPYSVETQNRLFAFAPPTRIHLIDEQGRASLRPFVYGLKPLPDAVYRYQEDRSALYPLRFFVAGAPYRVLGLFSTHMHLFGTSAGGKLFLLGTDALGRDEFSRLLYGGQISLAVALLATTIAIGVGFIAGGVAGYYGGWRDELVMRSTELFLSVPWLYLLLAIRAFLPLHLEPKAVFLLLMCVAGFAGWGRPARLVRGIVLSARDREYVLAARGFGASDLYILRTHVLPQAYVVVITQAALYIPQYVTAEVTLSFFGLGVSEPVPSWGNMLAEVRTLFVLENCWWMFAPAAALLGILALSQCLFRVQLRRIQASAPSFNN